MARLQVIGIPKKSAEDTTLHVTDSSGQKKTVFVPKGADITLHTPGLHYNRMFLLLSFFIAIISVPIFLHILLIGAN